MRPVYTIYVDMIEQYSKAFSKLSTYIIRFQKTDFQNILLDSDPIQFLYQYKQKEDIEIVALITALFSYGNVISIKFK